MIPKKVINGMIWLKDFPSFIQENRDYLCQIKWKWGILLKEGWTFPKRLKFKLHIIFFHLCSQLLKFVLFTVFKVTLHWMVQFQKFQSQVIDIYKPVNLSYHLYEYNKIWPYKMIFITYLLNNQRNFLWFKQIKPQL